MGANTTSGREQIDNMQEAIGFDGYNGVTTGDKEATLGVNCGLTTGRNGVLVKNAIGVDLYNQSLTGGVSKTLNSIATDSDHVPCVLVLNDQGGACMNVTENQTNALRAQEHGHQPCIVIEKSTPPPTGIHAQDTKRM